jgi:hypothetical protein
LIVEISRLSARERKLIAHSRGEETNMQPEPDKLAALIDTARALEAVGVRYAVSERSASLLPARASRWLARTISSQ